MQDHANKSQENQSSAVAKQELGKMGGSKAAFHFVDNSPEAIQLRKLQEITDNSLQGKQLASLQEKANNSPQAKGSARLQAMIVSSSSMVAQRQQAGHIFGGAAQLHEVSEEGKLRMETESASLQWQGAASGFQTDFLSANRDTVQRKMGFDRKTQYLDIDKNDIDIQSYQDTQKAAKANKRGTIEVTEGEPKIGTAFFAPDSFEWGGEIVIKPLGDSDLQAKGKEYHSRLIALAHETRHGLDDLEKTFNFRGKQAEKIRTEWRAFATQSAVAWEILNKDGRKNIEDRFLLELAGYANKAAFVNPEGNMFGVTQSYMILYGMAHEDSDVTKFMRTHDDWVVDALRLHQDLRPVTVPVQSWYVKYGIPVATAVVVTGVIAFQLARYFGLL